MSVYKDKTNGTWYAEFRYYDWNGEHKRHKKRGFATQREAKDYERDFLNKSHTDKHLTFKNLSELYLEDCKARLKATTYHGKVSQFDKHLVPYFIICDYFLTIYCHQNDTKTQKDTPETRI